MYSEGKSRQEIIRELSSVITNFLTRHFNEIPDQELTFLVAEALTYLQSMYDTQLKLVVKDDAGLSVVENSLKAFVTQGKAVMLESYYLLGMKIDERFEQILEQPGVKEAYEALGGGKGEPLPNKTRANFTN